MPCCGQKREALRNSARTMAGPAPTPAAPKAPGFQRSPPPAPAPPAVQPAQTPPGASHAVVLLEYLQRSPVRVRGPISGREYEFSAASRTQRVAAADAPALLRSGFFRHR